MVSSGMSFSMSPAKLAMANLLNGLAGGSVLVMSTWNAAWSFLTAHHGRKSAVALAREPGRCSGDAERSRMYEN